MEARKDYVVPGHILEDIFAMIIHDAELIQSLSNTLNENDTGNDVYESQHDLVSMAIEWINETNKDVSPLSLTIKPYEKQS